MKQKTTKILALFIAVMLVFTGAMPVFAANSPEVDEYFDSTYAKAIDPYGSLQKDENENFIIPLSKTSVTLKKDSYSKLYTAVWTSSDENYAKITSNYSSSATAKITHPTAAEGDKEVVMTLTLFDKNEPEKICGTRDYVLLITAQLPVYSLKVTAKNSGGEVIDDAVVSVQDSRNISLQAVNGVYSLTGSVSYTVTVSAAGYIRKVQTVALTEDKNMDVVLEKGTAVNFKVKTVSGSLTDYATIEVTSADGRDNFSCVLDEYGYETPVFELKAGEYKYDITYQSGSQNASGTFTVAESQTSLEIPVQLKNTEYKVKFDVDPKDATIALYKNGASGAYGDPILPDENGYYTIVFGQYRYTVEAEGFTTVSKTFNATDTSLKNNGYVIQVNLQSPYDKVLSDADDILFSVSGQRLLLSEYSGMHSDIDFGYYADIDSDYYDVNIKDTVEDYIAKKLRSDKPVKVDKILGIENEDYEPDYSVIDENGIIHYDAVTDDKLNFDGIGAEFTVKLVLSCENRTKESEIIVLVPEHITSRQERLDAAAEYACTFENIKGENTSESSIDKDLLLTDISSDISNDFTYYSICTGWSSDHPEIINPATGKVTPAEDDTQVTLTVKAYYSKAQLEEAGFLFDPGPLGENQSLRTITLLVKGTKPNTEQSDNSDNTEPSTPVAPAQSENDKKPLEQTNSSTVLNKENKSQTVKKAESKNENAAKHSPNTGNDISFAAVSVFSSLSISAFAMFVLKRKNCKSKLFK